MVRRRGSGVSKSAMFGVGSLQLSEPRWRIPPGGLSDVRRGRLPLVRERRHVLDLLPDEAASLMPDPLGEPGDLILQRCCSLVVRACRAPENSVGMEV
eukprot:5318148-Amphidinium_carterae.2